VWALPEDSSYRPLSPVRPAAAYSSRPGTSHSMSRILANCSGPAAPSRSLSPSREYSYDHEEPWAETARWLSSSGFKYVSSVSVVHTASARNSGALSLPHSPETMHCAHRLAD
jgi:hypothetical protein